MTTPLRLAMPIVLALAVPAAAGSVSYPPLLEGAGWPGLDFIVTGPPARRAGSVAHAEPMPGDPRALLVAAMGAEAAAGSAPHDVETPQAAREAGPGAATRSPMPFDIIRSLQFLQDQIARGNDRAIRVQALLLRRFGSTFRDAPDAVWGDARNRRAAVLFVLSGGPSEVLAALIRRDVLPAEDAGLFEGALAYVRNDLEKAERLLSAVDLARMEPGLAAHLHLVLGQIGEKRDPAGAMLHLDQARLLAPGGLIEEAALRMGVLLVEGLGEPTRADDLARQYLDRYHRSSYARNFEARFAAVQSGRVTPDPEAAFERLDDILAGLPDARRQQLLLAIGRRALVEGNLPFAALSAAAGEAIAPISARDGERARLYVLASTVAKADPSAARAALDGLDRSLLVAEDLPLLDAAYRVLGAITVRPVASVASGPQTPDPAASLPVIDRATRVLAEIEADLKAQTR